MTRGGGTERMASLIANKISTNENYKIIIVGLYGDINNSFFGLNQNIVYIVLNDKNKSNISIKDTVLKLRKVLSKNNVNILINVDVMLNIFSLPAIFCTKIKMITWEHFNYLDDIGSKNTKFIRKISMYFCKKYIVITKQDKEKFKKYFKGNSKVIQIYNTCMIDETYNDYDVNSKVIISAGNMFPVKGFDLAIEVGKIVFSKYPDWKWYIYGDGIELENIKTLIKTNRLENNFVLKARTKNLDKAFREAAMFILPSRMESFGLVLLEAQANNLPVVSFDVPSGPSEIISNNINGYLVEELNVNMMAEKICELIRNKDLRRSFSLKSKIKFKEFEIQTILSKWYEVIESI